MLILIKRWKFMSDSFLISKKKINDSVKGCDRYSFLFV